MSFPVLLLRGVFGLLVLTAIAYALSTNRKAINWRVVLIGISLQVVFALAVLKTDVGRIVFQTIGSGFAGLLNFTYAGSQFIFGPLAIPTGVEGSIGFIFATQVLPTIVFFASLMAVLYYVGLVQPIVKGLASAMAKTMKISGAEALSVAANVFVGQTEAPLVIRPYIERMTRSELMTLMAGGMATIAGGVLAAYVIFLGGDDPAQQVRFAAHLLSASIMSAPAAVVMAKILVPETGQPYTLGTVKIHVEKTDVNVLEAAASGASEGLKLALNVGAMLLAFLALLAVLNAFLGWLGAPVIAGTKLWDLNGLIRDASGGRFESLSLQSVFGYAFSPLAWAMGVEAKDILHFGSLLGEKVAVNEFVAYTSLAKLEGVMSDRSVIIATYALCGFANFSSIAIQIGGIGGLAPSRKSDIAALGIKAVIGGALASWMTASIAGILVG
ncbi:MAG: nucleoside transporter C-terminal domain-containing protein [Rhodothermales bacterium]|jgi:CNT family concentrative nucleoside transporter